ncbi:MAG: TnpV protein [Ruminococcaceae bacterium]|nr:TnpV protein [Oscillospiraceae bacterium]
MRHTDVALVCRTLVGPPRRYSDGRIKQRRIDHEYLVHPHRELLYPGSNATGGSLLSSGATAEGITEDLKATNQMEWVARMNNILSRVTEIVNNDLIF